MINDETKFEEETSERTFKLLDESGDGYIDPQEVNIIVLIVYVF